MKNQGGDKKLRFAINCSLAHQVMIKKLEEFSVNEKVFEHCIILFSLALFSLSLPQS